MNKKIHLSIVCSLLFSGQIGAVGINVDLQGLIDKFTSSSLNPPVINVVETETNLSLSVLGFAVDQTWGDDSLSWSGSFAGNWWRGSFAFSQHDGTFTDDSVTLGASVWHQAASIDHIQGTR